MAREAGHTVTDLQGSLVPLRDYGLGRELQGLSLRNVGLAVFEDRKKIYTDFGRCCSPTSVSAAPGAVGLRPHAALRQKRPIGWRLT